MAVSRPLYFIALNRLQATHKATIDQLAADHDRALAAWRAALQKLRIEAAITAGVPAKDAEAYVAEAMRYV
jgi:hypothetical protein